MVDASAGKGVQAGDHNAQVNIFPGDQSALEASGGRDAFAAGRDLTVNSQTFVTGPAPVALAQLPPLAAGFTGRDAELARVAVLLDPAAAGAAVVVSAVAGLAGVGKTALAVHAAHAARSCGWFPGGVLFIDLHGYDDRPVQPARALDALLRALGVPGEHIPEGTEQRAGLYRSALAQVGEPVLVIADNVSSEAQVRPLLPGPGPHRVIITSRHTLAGLGARLLDVTVLDQATAVQLLDTLVRAGRPDDDRISGDPAAAERLAETCGGLPLALQITAALLVADPTLTGGELAETLTDEVRRLEALRYDDGSGVSAPSVAAAFELSYRQLDEYTALMFRLLPTDPGPDLSTAAAAALAGWPPARTRTVLGRLTKAHLLAAGNGGAGRWRMHDLLRLYARQISDADAETDREHARDQLLGYYMDALRAARAHLQALKGTVVPVEFASRADALAWLDVERPNLIAAVTMAADTGRDSIAVALSLTLSVYLYWRRRFDDALTVLAISRDAAGRLDDTGSQAKALSLLGSVQMEMRQFEEAIAAHQAALAIFRRTGDRANEGVTLGNIGGTLQQRRRFEEAITAYRDAAAVFREIEDRTNAAITLGNLGGLLVEVRRFEEAITALQDALTTYREIGDQEGEAIALTNLGNVLRGMRRFEEAIPPLQEALAIFRKLGDRNREGKVLNNLGLTLRYVRRFKDAIKAHQSAASIYRETGDRHGEGNALNNVGLALQGVRRFDEAIIAHQTALAIYRETSDRQGEGRALNNLGGSFQEVRRFEEAIAAHKDALAIYREIGDRHSEASALTRLGSALQGARRFKEALDAHHDAASLYREAGDRHGEGTALNGLGGALQGAQRFEEAITAYRDATAIFRETSDQHHEGSALSNLGNAYQAMQQADRAIAYWREAAAAMRDAGDCEEAQRLDQEAADAQAGTRS